MREVRFALALRQYLAEHQLGVPDLDLAVHLLKLLQQFGLTAESGRVALTIGSGVQARDERRVAGRARRLAGQTEETITTVRQP